jgi:ribosomal protein S19
MDTDHVQILLAIQKDVSATREAVQILTGPEGRVAKLEAAMEKADNRQWLKAMVIAPVMVGLHAALRKLGVTI